MLGSNFEIGGTEMSTGSTSYENHFVPSLVSFAKNVSELPRDDVCYADFAFQRYQD